MTDSEKSPEIEKKKVKKKFALTTFAFLNEGELWSENFWGETLRHLRPLRTLKTQTVITSGGKYYGKNPTDIKHPSLSGRHSVETLLAEGEVSFGKSATRLFAGRRRRKS